jgi:hypothetical protein
VAPQARLKNGLLGGSFGLCRLDPGAPAPSSGASKKCAFSRGVTAAARARAVLVGPSPCRCRASRPPPVRARAVVRFQNFPVRARAVAPWLRRPAEARGGRAVVGKKEAHGGALLRAGCGAL